MRKANRCFMWSGWLGFLMVLASCSQQKQDLVQMAEDVESKDRGVDIKITPVEKNTPK